MKIKDLPKNHTNPKIANGNEAGGGFTPLEIQSGFAAKCGKISKKEDWLKFLTGFGEKVV